MRDGFWPLLSVVLAPLALVGVVYSYYALNGWALTKTQTYDGAIIYNAPEDD